MCRRRKGTEREKSNENREEEIQKEKKEKKGELVLLTRIKPSKIGKKKNWRQGRSRKQKKTMNLLFSKKGKAHKEMTTRQKPEKEDKAQIPMTKKWYKRRRRNVWFLVVS